jgi:hypothetical protein
VRRVADYSLWLGHIGDARDPGGLHAAGIAAVVDLALEDAPVVVSRELVYFRFPIIDGGGNPGWLLRAAVEGVAGLLRAGVPTLVCCGACMSRAPSVAGAAIALARGCPAREGLAVALEGGAADVSPSLWAELEAAMAPGAARQ